MRHQSIKLKHIYNGEYLIYYFQIQKYPALHLFLFNR